MESTRPMRKPFSFRGCLLYCFNRDSNPGPPCRETCALSTRLAGSWLTILLYEGNDFVLMGSKFKMTGDSVPRNQKRLCNFTLWALIFPEKWSYTVGTGVQMDRDVEFLKTVFAKSVFSIYPGLQITSLDLDSSIWWGLFSKPPSHAI